MSKTLRNINPQKNAEHKERMIEQKKKIWKQKRMEKIISYDLICKLYGSLFCLTTKKNHRIESVFVPWCGKTPAYVQSNTPITFLITLVEG